MHPCTTLSHWPGQAAERMGTLMLLLRAGGDRVCVLNLKEPERSEEERGAEMAHLSTTELMPCLPCERLTFQRGDALHCRLHFWVAEDDVRQHANNMPASPRTGQKKQIQEVCRPSHTGLFLLWIHE